MMSEELARPASWPEYREKPPTAWADLAYNGKAFVMATLSGNVRSAIDEKGLNRFLTPDVSNRELGQALLDILGASRIIPESEFEDFFYWKNIEVRAKKWLDTQCAYFGVKGISSVNKSMMFCNVEVEKGTIYIESCIHISTSAWKYFTDREAHTTALPYASPPEVVGAAIRTAIKLCDGNGRMNLKFPEPQPD
jgi:hypothetical protein